VNVFGNPKTTSNGREVVVCADAGRDLRAAVGAAVASVTIGVGTLIGGATPADAAVFHFSGNKPPFLGPVAGRYLSACPTTPNCISTGSDVYGRSYVPPWTYHAKDDSKPMSEAIADLKKVIEDYPGARVVEERKTKSDLGEGYYLRAEFESKFFGFVDDFEALFQPEKIGTAGYEKGSGIVDYRSASRLGEGDFNANRNRVKDLRVALQDKGWKSIGFR